MTQRGATVACPLPRATELACGNMPLVNLCDFGFCVAVRTTEARLCLLSCDVDKERERGRGAERKEWRHSQNLRDRAKRF